MSKAHQNFVFLCDTHIDIDVTSIHLLDLVYTNFSALHKIYKSSRSGDQNMAATLQVTDLCADVSSTIYNTWTHVRTVRKLQHTINYLNKIYK